MKGGFPLAATEKVQADKKRWIGNKGNSSREMLIFAIGKESCQLLDLG